MSDTNSKDPLAALFDGPATAIQSPGEEAADKSLDEARRNAKTPEEKWHLSKFKGFAQRFMNDAPVSWKFFAAMTETTSRAIEACQDDTAALEKRIRELEQRTAPTLRYLGIWSPGKAYEPGNFVTRSGSIWHCNSATVEPPSTDSNDWTLAVKHGRDAR